MPFSWNMQLTHTLRAVAVLLFFSIWELVADLRLIPPQFIAGPVEAILSLFNPNILGQIIANAMPSLYEIVTAYLVAVSLGIGIGLAIGVSKHLSAVFEPLMLALFAVPKITLLPLFILWLGVGISSKVAFGIFSGVFPIIVNIIAATKQLNPTYIQLARSIGAKQTQIYAKVVLPSIVPSAFAGMRLSLILVAVTVTLAEMYQGTVLGLGSLIFYWSTIFLAGPLYGLILVFSAILILINQVLLSVEKRIHSRSL